MKAKLSGGDLFGAVPLLNEFKKRVKEGEFKGAHLEKIDYFIGLGYMTGYTAKRDKNLLKKAADQFQHYIKTYPNGGDIHYVLLNKVDCHRGTGDFKGAIVTLKTLLAQPYISRLRIKERIDSMEKLVQAYYFEQMWDEGMPWFEKFLKITHDKEKKTMAAAALTEAYVAKEKFEKIEALLPHLNTNTKSRYDPPTQLPVSTSRRPSRIYQGISKGLTFLLSHNGPQGDRCLLPFAFTGCYPKAQLL